MTNDTKARWDDAARLIADHRDVLDGRPRDAETPAALVARGWAPFLLGCSDALLAAIEIDGPLAPWPDDTPRSLLQLVEAARSVCALPEMSPLPLVARSMATRRRETPRKRAQVDAFAAAVLPLAAEADRILDVGSGHGHLTRAVAERIDRPVIGLERDGVLAERARLLSTGQAHPPEFAQTDVLLEGLELTDRDCVIGLHACGELGDTMVESAARAGASLALVGCCLQKRRALHRAPLVDAGDRTAALHLPRGLLGLSNLTVGNGGVEATRAQNLAGRERRLALHRLLSQHEPELRHGAEIEGQNRRAAQADLGTLVARAVALRGLPAPSASRMEEAGAWARVHHARIRRLSVPRSLLARALEVFVLLDRACYMVARGYEVTMGCLFASAVSARNLVLVARRAPALVPARRGTVGSPAKPAEVSERAPGWETIFP